MLTADFSSAAVLISFGVVLGKTSPLQLILMAMIEIVLFVGNEVLGRAVFGVSLFNITYMRILKIVTMVLIISFIFLFYFYIFIGYRCR